MFLNQQYFETKTGSRLLLLLVLILYQRSKGVNVRKLLNQIRDLTWDDLCGVVGVGSWAIKIMLYSGSDKCATNAKHIHSSLAWLLHCSRP